MIGLDNPLHLAILFAVLLLIFGGKRLPDMGRSLGAGLRNFKESVSGREPAGELSVASVEEAEAAKTR